MKRLLFLLVALSMFVAADAAAVCQKCLSDNSPRGMCWTLGACESGATMSACVVRSIMGDPDRLWCD